MAFDLTRLFDTGQLTRAEATINTGIEKMVGYDGGINLTGTLITSGLIKILYLLKQL